jgi:hypothetical protein
MILFQIVWFIPNLYKSIFWIYMKICSLPNSRTSLPHTTACTAALTDTAMRSAANCSTLHELNAGPHTQHTAHRTAVAHRNSHELKQLYVNVYICIDMNLRKIMWINITFWTYPRYSVRATVRCNCGSPHSLSFWRVSPTYPPSLRYDLGGQEPPPSRPFDLLRGQDPPFSRQNDLLWGQEPPPSRRDVTCRGHHPGSNLRNSWC